MIAAGLAVTCPRGGDHADDLVGLAAKRWRACRSMSRSSIPRPAAAVAQPARSECAMKFAGSGRPPLHDA
jgi:hypothetical protein